MICYSLSDPRTAVVRYVGRSINPDGRFKDHLGAPHSKRLAEWFADLSDNDLKPVMTILEGRTEREWIEGLRPDLNVAKGDSEENPTRKDGRERYQFCLSEDRQDRWEKVAKANGQTLASFIRSTVEEKIRRDGLA